MPGRQNRVLVYEGSLHEAVEGAPGEERAVRREMNAGREHGIDEAGHVAYEGETRPPEYRVMI
jgi:hypothetical protein